MPNLQHTPIVKRMDEKAPVQPQDGATSGEKSSEKLTPEQVMDQFNQYLTDQMAKQSLDANERSICNFMEIAIPYVVEGAAIFKDTDDLPPGTTEAMKAFQEMRNSCSDYRHAYVKTGSTSMFEFVGTLINEMQSAQKFSQTLIDWWKRFEALVELSPDDASYFSRFTKEKLIFSITMYMLEVDKDMGRRRKLQDEKLKRQREKERLEQEKVRQAEVERQKAEAEKEKTRQNTSTPVQDKSMKISFLGKADGIFEESTRDLEWDYENEAGPDPYPGLDFDDRKKKEASLPHFQRVMKSVSHIVRKFNSLMKTLRKDIESPFPNEVIIRGDLQKLELAFGELREARFEATKNFSQWTNRQDCYLDEKFAQIEQIKEEAAKYLMKAEAEAAQPVGAQARTVLYYCESCPITTQTAEELEAHKAVWHPPTSPQRRWDLDDDMFEPRNLRIPARNNGARKRTPPPILGGNWSDHSSPRESVGPSVSQRGSEVEAVANSLVEVRNVLMEMKNNQQELMQKQYELEAKRQRETMRYQMEMLRTNAEYSLKPEEYCAVFDPDKLPKKKDLFKIFSNWLMDFNQLTKVMDTLQLTQERKYHYLKGRVGGRARGLISLDNPGPKSFERSLAKLKANYYSKALATRDVYNRLKTLPKMHPTSPQQVMEFATSANALISELSDKNMSKNDVMFLLLSEILVPKLNKTAATKWNRTNMNRRVISEEDPLGHVLSVEDLKDLITESAREAQFEEFSKVYNSQTEQGNSQGEAQGKKADDKKKKDESKDREMTYSYSTQAQAQSSSNEKSKEKIDKENKMPQSKKGNCLIPGCGQPMDSAKGGHDYVLKCPKLKAGMTNKQRRDWFNQQKCQCLICFSTSHKFQRCPLVNMAWAKPCMLTLTSGPKKGQKCNEMHNVLLCTEEWKGRSKEQKPSNTEPPNAQGEAEGSQ